MTKIPFQQRVRILGAIIAASILIAGVVLAGVMTMVTFGFLAAGAPLDTYAMWAIWFCGLVIWIFGAVTVREHLNDGIWYAGGIVFILLFFANLFLMMDFGEIAQPYYYTLVLPITLGIVLAATFLTYIVNFVGLNSEEPEVPEKVKSRAEPGTA